MTQTASRGILWRIGALFGISLLSIGIFSNSVGAQENSAPATIRPPSVAPYDSRLQRLSEVLGSIHYLRNLCGETSNQWRDQMEGLLAVEKPTPNRRARLIAEFNKGYRSFNSVYTTCTPQALTAVDRYMNEGKALAGEINSRYAE